MWLELGNIVMEWIKDSWKLLCESNINTNLRETLVFHETRKRYSSSVDKLQERIKYLELRI